MNESTKVPSLHVDARMVAAKLNCGISTVYVLFDTGAIRSVRIGRKLRRTSWEWVQQHLDANPGTVCREVVDETPEDRETADARYFERITKVRA